MSNSFSFENTAAELAAHTDISVVVCFDDASLGCDLRLTGYIFHTVFVCLPEADSRRINELADVFIGIGSGL